MLILNQLQTFLPFIILFVGAVLPVAIIMLWVYSRDKLREHVSVVAALVEELFKFGVLRLYSAR